MGFILSKNKSPSNEAEAQPSSGAEDDGVPKDAIEYCEQGLEKLQGDEDCHSLLKKHFTGEVLEALKTKQTSSFSSNLRDVIQSGVENLDSGIGVYAPDAEVVFSNVDIHVH